MIGVRVSLEFRFGGAEDTVVVVQLWTTVAGVLKLHTVQVQVLLLDFGRRLGWVLLRV